MNYNPNIHHRRSIRLKGYDYAREGAYFITICCRDRKCRFGKIVIDTNENETKNTNNGNVGATLAVAPFAVGEIRNENDSNRNYAVNRTNAGNRKGCPYDSTLFKCPNGIKRIRYDCVQRMDKIIRTFSEF